MKDIVDVTPVRLADTYDVEIQSLTDIVERMAHLTTAQQHNVMCYLVARFFTDRKGAE